MKINLTVGKELKLNLFVNPYKSGGEGSEGPKGDDGLSAYEVWVSLGNTGTEAQFIASLKGDKGDKGDPGDSSTIAIASQAEAEDNTENTKVMTSLRVFQNWLNNVTNYSISALTTTSKTLLGAINELVTSLSGKQDKPLLNQTFTGEFNLSTGGEVSYKITLLNTSLTPTVSTLVEDSFARVVIDAGASALLVTTNMGTQRVGSDTFTAGKKNEIIMTCLPDGTDGALVKYYSIKILN